VLKVLQNLLDLQGVDVRLSQVRARLALFPKKLAEVDARVAAARAALDHSKAAQVTAIKDRKKYELDVEQWKERVRKYKDQTAQIKTNEAYKALLHEIQLAEQEISRAEDRLLEEMVSSEEYDRQVKAAEAALKATDEITRRERAAIEVEKAAQEKDLAALTAERARVVAEIPEDTLDHYERIARKHGGKALAEVVGEKCSACGMVVRPHVFQQMRHAGSPAGEAGTEEMFHCETCTRILYYIEPEAPAVTAAGGPAVPPAGGPAPASAEQAASAAEN